MALPTRAEAYALLCEWVESESLRRHMLAVEAALRSYARHFHKAADPPALNSIFAQTL